MDRLGNAGPCHFCGICSGPSVRCDPTVPGLVYCSVQCQQNGRIQQKQVLARGGSINQVDGSGGNDDVATLNQSLGLARNKRVGETGAGGQVPPPLGTDGGQQLGTESDMQSVDRLLVCPVKWTLSQSEAASASPSYHHDSLKQQLVSGEMKRNTPEWMMQVCQFLIRDLDQYGICVIDNFLGAERGDSILHTVESMYDSGVFREGETVNSKPKITGNIRGDKIAWVDGTEPHCQTIAYLISMVDSVITNARRKTTNGKLAQHQISDRTKAMVACYPGSGTHYVKHVDNPNKDGRCITSIYYLNRDWNIKEDGGLLRIFPQGWTNKVADIEPIFDRIVFFWSDRRNPHEVQPAYRTRYAITLWYFDAKEREEARLRQRDQRTYAAKSQSVSP